MRMEDLILQARARGASDLHISEGTPIRLRIDGALIQLDTGFSPAETRALILSTLSEADRDRLLAGEDLDFALETADGGRQRVNLYTRRGGLCAAVRLLNAHVPTLEELHLPEVLKTLAEEPRGLILVTGPTGSGKSTTLAAMLRYINETRAVHILTAEDPVEYVHEERLAMIHQREVGPDVASFSTALRSALREDPDVILVGEMRDFETISAALTAAETGHLVLSTLHTTGAEQTIDRIIDACPGESQQQVRTQLAGVLRGVITQCLVPTADGRGRVAATEVLLGTDAALNLIRESKCHQLGSVMQAGGTQGMHTLNSDLARLCRRGIITRDEALRFSSDKRELQQFLN